MIPTNLLVLALAFLLLAGAAAGWWKRRNTPRKRVRAVGFPLPWLPLLEEGLPVYLSLPYDLRESLQEKAFAKINDLTFTGPGGVDEVTEAMRVSLGAHLGVLHAHLRIPPIPSIRHIVVGREEDVAAEHASASAPWGDSTLLAIWEPSVGAARHFLEERDEAVMAHWRRLRGTGGPPLPADHLYYAGWARSLHTDVPESLAEAAAIAPELGENAALFAAATEAFLRHPQALAQKEPALFQGLKRFYRFDPTRWNAKEEGAPAKTAAPPASRVASALS